MQMYCCSVCTIQTRSAQWMGEGLAESSGGAGEWASGLTLAHGIDYAKDVHIVGRIDLLQYAIQCDEGAGSANASAAVHQNGTLLGADAISERADETNERLGGIGYTKIGPCDEVEVPQDALFTALLVTKRETMRIRERGRIMTGRNEESGDGRILSILRRRGDKAGAEATYATQHKLGHHPVGVVAIVEYLHLDVAIEDGHRVVGPVLVALLAALLEAAGEHDNRPGVALPAHAPEIVACGVQRALGDNEFTR